MRVTVLVSILLLTCLSQPAFAYLDPGSGSMLIAGIVGLLASLMFFLKGLYYKGRRVVLGLFGRAGTENRTRHPMVFYSEGRQYWNTFRPVIDELAGRGQQCVYLSSDEQDPGLLYSSERVETKYIGSGTKAYSYLAVLEADVCAMTTPGLDVLQIKRSKGVGHYAHLVHAPTDMGTYKQYSFDYYDSVFISGDHQEKSLRRLEELRRTPRKRLVKTGCLYYDAMYRQLEELGAKSVSQSDMTVLVAPTWGANGLLKKFGARILTPLLEKQWNVIVRPHPQSYISEREMLDGMQQVLKQYPNLQWDRDKDGTRAMARANAMVSDLSGMVFDFAFLFEKPVITVKFEITKVGSEAADLPWDPWELTVLETIGRRIEESELAALPGLIEQECGRRDRRQMIQQLRETSVVNFGCAAKPAADELLRIRDEVAGKQAK
jgi:hypothetical protein